MKNFIYKQGAKYYDKIYSFIDYKKESDFIDSLVHKYKKSSGKELIDVACGTGNHLAFLKDKYNVLGIDSSKEMLKIAKQKNEKIDFILSDMINLSLKKKFDILICLASSISYLQNYKKLEKAVKKFSNHLNSGGIMIIEPWQIKNKDGVSGKPYLLTYDSPDLKIARVGVLHKKGILSILETGYLIAERNKKIKKNTEVHRLADYEKDRFTEIINRNNMDVYIENDNFYIGIKK